MADGRIEQLRYLSRGFKSPEHYQRFVAAVRHAMATGPRCGATARATGERCRRLVTAEGQMCHAHRHLQKVPRVESRNWRTRWRTRKRAASLRGRQRQHARSLHRVWRRDPWLQGHTIVLPEVYERQLAGRVAGLGLASPDGTGQPVTIAELSPRTADWLRWKMCRVVKLGDPAYLDDALCQLHRRIALDWTLREQADV